MSSFKPHCPLITVWACWDCCCFPSLQDVTIKEWPRSLLDTDKLMTVSVTFLHMVGGIRRRKYRTVYVYHISSILPFSQVSSLFFVHYPKNIIEFIWHIHFYCNRTTCSLVHGQNRNQCQRWSSASCFVFAGKQDKQMTDVVYPAMKQIIPCIIYLADNSWGIIFILGNFIAHNLHPMLAGSATALSRYWGLYFFLSPSVCHYQRHV